MTFAITTPAGTARYSLTSDLRIMADEIATHLDTLQAATSGAVTPNTAPTFLTITTTNAPTFPSITVTGTRAQSKIMNDVDGFGLKSGSLKFSTTDSAAWTSSGHINVPNGGTGTQAINRTALDTEKNALTTLITDLTARVTAIENAYASMAYVDGKDLVLTNGLNAANARITALEPKVNAKANYSGDVNTVLKATSATSATSATTATTAENSNKLSGRSLRYGSFDAGTLVGGGSGARTISHTLGYVPIVVATAYNDDGVPSIIVSLGTISATAFEIKYKNINPSSSETFRVNWIAI